MAIQFSDLSTRYSFSSDKVASAYALTDSTGPETVQDNDRSLVVVGQRIRMCVEDVRSSLLPAILYRRTQPGDDLLCMTDRDRIDPGLCKKA